MPCWKQVVGKLLSNLITATVIYNIIEHFGDMYMHVFIFQTIFLNAWFSPTSIFLFKQLHFKSKTW